MQYISYKPWIGKNYQQQAIKILFIVHPFNYRKLGINLATYAHTTENSVIKYLNDFITHELDDRTFMSLP